MFQVKANINVSPCNEGDSRKKKHKKAHISYKRKHHSRRGHSKHGKRWDLKINNPHLNHAKYTSDYIGPERLTNHLLGFLGKGKISDSISRLEKIMPENCKARSMHDLNRILNFSSSEIHSYNQDYLSHTSKNYNSSREGSSSSSPSPESHRAVRKCVSVDSKKEKSNFPVNLDTSNSMTSKNSSSSPCNKYDEAFICREVITNKLHSAVQDANKAAYPNISNQNRLIRELLNLKNECNSCKKAFSSSNNCESSQDTKNSDSLESLEKNDFKLNPILTQESPIAKNIENMFPNSQNLSSNNTDSDSIMSDDSVLLHSNNIPMPHDHDETKLSVSSSCREGSLTLIPSSPISSSGSPVWAPELSPMRFVPDILPTPKLFYRQKMF